jgi:hypothetical protein
MEKVYFCKVNFKLKNMTVVNSKEFSINQTKYFNLALSEDVVIRRGKNIYHLIGRSDDNANIPAQPILEPDDDLRRAITMEDLRIKMHKRIHELFTDK